MKASKSQSKSERPRRAFSRLEAVLLLGVSVGVAICAGPHVLRARQAPDPDEQTRACMVNLKKVSLGVMQYAQDYDEKYPPLSVRSPHNPVNDGTPVGWADAMQPYIKNPQVYQCPSDAFPSSLSRVLPQEMRAPGEPTALSDAAQMSGYSDYWLNANLNGATMSALDRIAQTVMLGDGDGGAINSNARYNLYSLPVDWNAPGSPSRRHLDMGCYAFADGHVQRLPFDTMADETEGARPFAISELR